MYPKSSKSRVLWGRGGLQQKKPKKKQTIKPVPNIKFAEAFVFFRYFSFLLFRFFGLSFKEKLKPFQNHVTSEVLR